ncbi:MAG: Mur ligase family protein, partial [Defluviitaleaceae bacterium]|nr:Mur ligase family protein [Defluviitaleaceae bacterium]
MSEQNRPVIDFEFMCKALRVIDPEQIKEILGENAENMIFSAARLVVHPIKDCIAFVTTRHDDPHYMKILNVLRERHGALPDGDPNKLTPAQIEEEVIQFQYNELCDKAMEKGAAVLVTSKQRKDYPCILVPHVRNSFFKFYEYYMSHFKTVPIQVTGSFGKTSACGIVYDMLVANNKNVHRNKANGNDWLGLANAINKLEYEHEFYVQETQEAPIEWTASEASKILKPKVAVITNAGESHVSVMKTRANVAHACLGIQDGVPKDGLIVANGDDSLLRKKLKKTKAPAVFYALNNDRADYIAENIKSSREGMSFDIKHKGKNIPVQMPVLGDYNAYNALIAYITGKHVGLSEEEIVKGIANFKTQGIRQNLVEANGRTLFIDCYNASPDTTCAAIKTISDIEIKKGRHVAILGHMSELGADNESGHRQVGQAIADSNIEVLICYGLSTSFIAEEARKKPGIKIFEAINRDDLISIIKKETREDDFILIKASRIYLEIAIDCAYGTYFTLESEDQYENIKPFKWLDYNIYIAPIHTKICEYLGTSEHVAVRGVFGDEKTNQYSITFGIENRAFADKNFLKSVTIPGTLKSIGKEAFINCINLAEIYIPPSVINIGKNAFANCPVKIFGEKNSYAEEYAKKNKIAFVEHEGAPQAEIEFTKVPVTSVADAGCFTVKSTAKELSKAELALQVSRQNTVFAQDNTLFAAKKLVEEAEKFGIDIKNISAEKKCSGCAEHETGLAIDLIVCDGDVRTQKWLRLNAYQVGLISEHDDKPWHFRYIGKPHTFAMKKNNFSTVAEYLEFLKKENFISVEIENIMFQIFRHTPEDEKINVPKGLKYSVSADGFGGFIMDTDVPLMYAVLSDSCVDDSGSKDSAEQTPIENVSVKNVSVKEVAPPQEPKPQPSLSVPEKLAKTLTIGKLQILVCASASRLVSQITVNNQKFNIWLEVGAEYEKYFVTDRCDAFLLGMLQFAMRQGLDIVCEAPVTAELLYNLQNHVLPTLSQNKEI